MTTISGRIEPTDPTLTELGGCRVEGLFPLEMERETLDRMAGVRGGAATLARATAQQGHVSGRTDAAGHFRLSIPDEPRRSGDLVRFVVSGPAGQTIGDQTEDIEPNRDAIVIVVDMTNIAPIVLDAPLNIPRARTRRITGLVLDRSTGGTVPANSQVLLLARKASDVGPADAVTPVMVARTDASGNFFGEAPNEAYTRAAAVVAGIPDELAIALTNGMIPGKLSLFVELPDLTPATRKTDCCGSTDITPRTPSQADIENAPNTYSIDLGTGHCVRFNTPNRAIEEFDFYSVVRTTEPDIVGFNTGGDLLGRSVATDPLATIAPAAAATAAADAANAAAAAAAADAAQKEITANRAEAFSAKYAAALATDKVKDTIKQILNDRRGVGWSHALAKTLVMNALTQEGLDIPTALARAEALANAVASVSFETVHTRDGDVTNSTVQAIVDAAASGAAAAATAAREAADAAAAKKASTAKTAASAAQAATAAESAKAAEVAERAQALETAARAALELQKVRSKPPGREELNRNNPIDWDETPTFYQSAEIAHGHLLHFKQVWYADGYSLGDLLYSLPLAPGQKKLISVVDWERRERTERIEDTLSSEGVSAVLSRDRDLGEVVTGALTESSRGGSKSTSVGVGVGAGAAGNGSYQGFNFGALVGVSGGYGQSDSSAWQDSARNLSSSSLQTLRDRTMQSASAIRGLRSSVVHTVAQGEAVRATTEVVANHNHCHAMTVQYFEVLRHLKLVHELSDVQECLFVPLPLSRFDLAKALRWRQSLHTYLQRRELATGFDAARRVQTKWLQVDSPPERYGDENIRSLAGELLLTVTIPMPPLPEKPKPKPEDTAADTATAVSNAIVPTEGVWGVLLAIGTGGASLIAGKATEAAINVSKAAGKGVRGLVDEFYAEPTPQERYEKFHAEIMPGVIEGFVDQLELWALIGSKPVHVKGADFTLVSSYQPGVPLLVALRGTLAGQIRRSDISQLIIKSGTGVPSGCKAIVNSAMIRYRTATFEHALVEDGRVNDDIDPPKVTGVFSATGDFSIQPISVGTGATLLTPLDAWEQRSPRTDDQRLASELVDHLNDNLEYYHHAIWWTMDPNRRYMLLDGYYAPGSQNRSVASVVENRLIGIVGNSVVLPVARGVHLNPRFVTDAQGKRADLLDFYKLDTPVPAARVSLPTRGVFAEAVMGSCNSCEEIDESKFWRWEESAIDEPPSIEPISTSTRRGDPASILPSPFPAPIVSIQNAPGAPDPIGVGRALEALGKQSFADITGLAGTQANAAAAYSQALDTAFKFGKEASTLAQQASMTKSLDKTMNAIDKAETAGQIDPASAKKLRMTAFEKVVGTAPGALTPQDVAERVKIVDEFVGTNSIKEGDAQAINKSLLGSLAGEGTGDDLGIAVGQVAGGIDAKDVASITGPDGTNITTGLGELPTRFAKILLDASLGKLPPPSALPGKIAEDVAGEVVTFGVKLVEQSVKALFVDPDLTVEAPDVNSSALLSDYPDATAYLPGGTGVIQVHFFRLGNNLLVDGLTGQLTIKWEDCFLDVSELRPADADRGAALSAAVCKRNISFLWHGGTVAGIDKAFVKAGLSVPSIRLKAKVIGPLPAVFRCEVHLSYGYTAIGLPSEKRFSSLVIDLPQVTDSVQIQDIMITDDANAAGSSPFRVTISKFM